MVDDKRRIEKTDNPEHLLIEMMRRRGTYATANLSQIPSHMYGALGRYVFFGIPPGSFLTAVICNDLKGAVGRADALNQKCLADWVTLFYNDLPMGCFGSKDKMDEWQEQGGLAALVNAGKVHI